MATVYRFRNAAAVALTGKGETRYLSAPAARGVKIALGRDGGRYTVDGLSLVTFRKRHGLKA